MTEKYKSWRMHKGVARLLQDAMDVAEKRSEPVSFIHLREAIDDEAASRGAYDDTSATVLSLGPIPSPPFSSEVLAFLDKCEELGDGLISIEGIELLFSTQNAFKHLGSRRDKSAAFAFLKYHAELFTAEMPKLTCYIDPGRASASVIVELLSSISGLHEAHGGLGLTFAFDGQYVRTAAPVVS
jgi:hypothetical protein